MARKNKSVAVALTGEQQTFLAERSLELWRRSRSTNGDGGRISKSAAAEEIVLEWFGAGSPDPAEYAARAGTARASLHLTKETVADLYDYIAKESRPGLLWGIGPLLRAIIEQARIEDNGTH